MASSSLLRLVRASALLIGTLASVEALAGVGHGLPKRKEPAKSVGSPTDGHLVGGQRLADGPHLRIVPAYAEGDVRWGTDALVSLVDQAARTVRKQFPDAVLSVGHLSRAGGGELDRHASHESGRDADLGFYVRHVTHAKPVYPEQFVPFRPDGTSAAMPGAQFDDAKNWALVAAISSCETAHVTHVFVADYIKSRLLAYAEKIHASPQLRARAAELMAQPRGAQPHDDHFHVRIGCPSGPGGQLCIEDPVARRSPKSHKPVAHAHAPARPGVRKPTAPKVSAVPQDKPSESDAEGRIESKIEQRLESLVPNLAPIVAGLGSAVLATPSAPSSSDSSTAHPIDDPDGITQEPSEGTKPR